MTKKGFISLVGSGPGDPELLTVPAWRLLLSPAEAHWMAERLLSEELQ
jgi:siroheme synthase